MFIAAYPCVTTLFFIGSGLVLKSLDHETVSAGAVFQALGYAADGGGAHARFAADVKVVGTVREHASGLESLGYFQDLLDGADILKECVAFLSGFQRKNGIEQDVRVGIMQRFHGCCSR